MFRRFCLAGVLAAAGLLASLFVSIKPVLADGCGGEVSIARMNWASAELVAEIDKVGSLCRVWLHRRIFRGRCSAATGIYPPYR